jgi:Raf kinase inhibitor-like YbhB/YbcL family protein
MPGTPSSRNLAGLAVALAFAGAGCGSGGASSGSTPATTPTAPARRPVPVTIRLTSPVVADGRPIPRRFTCDAQDNAPPLRWSGVPGGTAQLALVLEDDSARGESGGPFVHWSVFGIPPSATEVPGGARQGTTDFHETHYGGPCPPDNDPPHRYVFTLYALRAPLELPAGAPPPDLRAAIARTAATHGRLTFTYARGG